MSSDYWIGVATPFMAVVALAVVAGVVLAVVSVAGPSLRGFADAVRLLRPARQRLAVKLFERDLAHHSLGRADLIFALERALASKPLDPPYPRLRWPLRFVRLGLLPIIAKATPRLADEYRKGIAERDEKQRVARAELDAERAEREAADAAAKSRFAELVGEPNASALYVQLGRPHPFRDGLDEVVFLPEAEDFEPDPDRPGVMVKSPALAVRVRTIGWPVLSARMAGDDSARYDGISVGRRLEASHPHLFAQQGSSPEQIREYLRNL